MAAVPPGTQTVLNTGQVNNPASTRNTDGTLATVQFGLHGEMQVADIHGKYFAAAKRGNLFTGSSLIAGVAIPVNAATLVSKFTLWNPASSGKDVELVEFAIGIDSATEVVNGLAMGYQRQVSVVGAPSALTAAAGGQVNFYTGGAPLANLYTAATMTNTAVLGPLLGIGVNFDATSAGMRGLGTYLFDGKVVIPPDTIVTFVSTVAAITAAFCSLTWAEWPA